MELMRLNEIEKVEDRFLGDFEVIRMAGTARAAHEYKAKYETMVQLGEAAGAKWRSAREENEKLREANSQLASAAIEKPPYKVDLLKTLTKWATDNGALKAANEKLREQLHLASMENADLASELRDENA